MIHPEIPTNHDFPLTSNTGLALLYTDKMCVMPFLDKLSLFSASVTRREEHISAGPLVGISHKQ